LGSSAEGVTNAGKPGDYLHRIRDGYFTLVALNSTTTPQLDQEIIAAMTASHRYRRLETVPYIATFYAGHYTIWERRKA
jgi:hypothetical protein